jgi:ACS family glucarate transporter-like MFS transporter
MASTAVPTTTTPPGAPAARGTRIRFRVVALGTTLAMVTYLDRVSMGTIAPIVTKEWQLTPSQTGWIFSSFALAYAIFEIPTAKWAEKLGTKSVLTRIVLWWSAFTAATAMAFNLPSMLLVRFLFGAGEAGAWPMAARAFSSWIPRLERATIQGIFFAGAHLVGGLTPPLIGVMLFYMSWRTTFVVFGLVGLVWVAAWRKWFENDPTEHPEVDAAELAHILHGRPPDSKHTVGREYWGRLFFSRNVVLLCLMYLSNSTIFYFCITWLPTYLRNRHGFDASTLGFLSGLPLLVSVPSDLFGGTLSDRLCAKYGMRVGRCYLGAVAYALTSAFLFLAASSSTPIVAAVAIATATGLTMLTLGAAWGTCIEVARNHAGVVGAVMNTSGQVASLLIPLVVGYSVEWFNNWDFPIYMLACMFLVGTVCWLLIDPHKPVFDAVAA